MRRYYAGIFGLVIFIFLVTSCDDLFSKTILVEFDYETFKEERDLWNESKPKDYSFVLGMDGGMVLINTLITVRDGQFFGETAVPDEYGRPGHETTRGFTIDDHYRDIEQWYLDDNNTNRKNSEEYTLKIEIIYDTENHIPIETIHHSHTVMADSSPLRKIKISEFAIDGF
jgi:hypothetical protein